MKDPINSSAEKNRKIIDAVTKETHTIDPYINFGAIPLLIILIIYGVSEYDFIFNMFKNIVETLTFSAIPMYPGISLAFIYALTLMFYTLPFTLIIFKSEATIKLIKRYIQLILIFLVIMIIFNLLWAPTAEAQNNSDIVKQKFDKSKSTIWSTLVCALQMNNEGCKAENLDAKQAETSKGSQHSIIALSDKRLETKTIKNFLKQGIKFQYTIKATKDLKLIKFECYHTNKKDENLFYSETLNEEITTSNSGTKTFTCKTGNLTLENKETQELIIYPVLTSTLDLSLTQEIPVINYAKYSEQKNIKKEDSTYRNGLDKIKNNAKLTKSADDLDLSSTLNSQYNQLLPIVLNDNEIEDRQFSIYIEKGITDIGKPEEVVLTDITLPEILKFNKDNEPKLPQKIELGFDNFPITLSVVDNEDYSLKKIESHPILKLKFKINFEKSSDYKIEITKSEEEVTKEKQRLEELKKQKEETVNKNTNEQTTQTIEKENIINKTEENTFKEPVTEKPLLQ